MSEFVNSGKDQSIITLKHSKYWDKKGNKVESEFKSPLNVHAFKIQLSDKTEEYIITNVNIPVPRAQGVRH